MQEFFLTHGFWLTYLAFPLLFFCFFLLVGVSAIVERHRHKTNSALPLTISRARLVNKRVTPGHQHHFSGAVAQPDYSFSFARYHAVFELEDGMRRRFSQTCAQFRETGGLQWGKLTWRGTQFISFVEQSDMRKEETR